MQANPPPNLSPSLQQKQTPEEILDNFLKGFIDQEQVLVEFFSAWDIPPREATHAMQGAVKVRILKEGELLFKQGDPLVSFYLLIAGKIRQERVVGDAEDRHIGLTREAIRGEWLGHFELIYEQRYGTRAYALTQCVLIEINASAASRLLNRYPYARPYIAPTQKIERLRTVPLFANVDIIPLCYVAQASTLRTYKENEVVYERDTPADNLYVVDQGQVLFSGHDYPWSGVGNGMAFGIPFRNAGTQSSQHEPPAYGHTATASVPSSIFIVERQALTALTEILPEIDAARLRYQAEQALAQTMLFVNYDKQERRNLLAYASHYVIPHKHLIQLQGEVSDSMWILMDGSPAILYVLKNGQALEPIPFNGPSFFSQLALIADHTVRSSIQAEPQSHWLRIHQSDFRTFCEKYGESLKSRLNLSEEDMIYLGTDKERQRRTWLQSGEILVIERRRHLLAMLRNIWPSLLISIAIVVIWATFATRGWLDPWHITVFGIFGIISLIIFLWGFFDYQNDFLLVTNQRIVRQEEVLFFNEHRQVAFLEQIRNIDIQVDFWGNLFRYGNLRIQTAATSGTIDFDLVPDASRIKQIILEQQNLRQQHYQASSKIVIQTLIEDRLGVRPTLPKHIIPPDRVPTIKLAGNWWDWITSIFDIQSYLEIRTDARVIWRKHWIILLGKLTPALTTLFTILVLIVGEQLLPASLRPFIDPLNILFAAIGLFSTVWIAWIVADWRNDTYEIDEKQIADVQKRPLFFSEQRRTALLGEIENIEVHIPSPIHYLLNFGNVRLSTAATQGQFFFDWVPDPRGVSEEIRHRIEVYRYQQENNRARQRAQELPDWFEMYDHIKSEDEEEKALRRHQNHAAASRQRDWETEESL